MDYGKTHRMLTGVAAVLWVATGAVLLSHPAPDSTARLLCFVLPVVATGVTVLAVLPRVLGDYFRSMTLGYLVRDRELRDPDGRGLHLVRGGSS